MTETGYAHIVIDDKGRPVIAGTRAKVAMIAIDKTVWGWDADQIRKQYPHLTLGQIHSALAYYFDHQEEIDRYIAETDRAAEAMRVEMDESPGRKKLRALGLIP